MSEASKNDNKKKNKKGGKPPKLKDNTKEAIEKDFEETIKNYLSKIRKNEQVSDDPKQIGFHSKEDFKHEF